MHKRVALVVVALLALVGVAVPAASTAAAAPVPGDEVYIGSGVGYGGTRLFPIWLDGTGEGEPDAWSYCIEHDVSAETQIEGHVGDIEDFLGTNYFADADVQAHVFWVLAHSYPAMTLEEFGAAVGVPGISENDAIEATQYAIWRYTDLGFDAPWAFETADSGTAYWWLVNNANALALTAAPVTASISGPAGDVAAGSLVGPFVVSTSEPTAQVSVDPAYDLVDAAGDAIDPNAVVDGQELYVDARDEVLSGSATVTVSATGSNQTGNIISVPTVSGGDPADAHAQTIILVGNSAETVTDSASGAWVGEVGTFDVRKIVDGDAADLVGSDEAFSLSATWDGGSASMTVLKDGEWVTSPEVPVGIQIDVEELTPPDIEGVDWAEYTITCFDGNTLLEGASFTLTAQSIVSCTVVNTASPTPVPVIATSLVDGADGDQVVAFEGGTVVDTVFYENLVPGTEYTITGELMDKADATGTGITGSVTFTPTEATGTVDVNFEIPTGYAGTTLVAFEWLYAGTDVEAAPLAEHTDIDDAAQTVTVADAPVIGDGGGSDDESPVADDESPVVDDESPVADDESPTDQPSVAPDTDTESLPTTGTDASALVTVALLTVLAGLGLLYLRRRRGESMSRPASGGGD